MHYVCYKCGEIFETPFYKKDRFGRHVPCCPACGDTEDIEEEQDQTDEELEEFYDSIIDYEIYEE